MTTDALRSFYAENRLGNLFGVKGPHYDPVTGHRGVDWIHGAGKSIPSWASGIVRQNSFFPRHGYTVIVEVPGLGFAGFCHLIQRSPLGVGSRVAVGQSVGQVGETGSATTGPHLHATLEPTIILGTTRAMDPLPYIRAARDATTEKETTMPILVPLVVGNPPQMNGDYAIIGDGGIVGLRAKEDASIINTAKRAMLDGEPIYGNQGDQLQELFARVAVKVAAPPINYDELAEALAPKLAALMEIPTAEETAAATRKAIIVELP